LVKSTKKGTRTTYIVSDKFIEVCQTNRANFKITFWSGEPVRATKRKLLKFLKNIRTFETVIKTIFEKHELKNLVPRYEAIKKELEEIEVRFKDHIADLRNERNYLRKSLDNQQEQFSKLLQAVQQRNLIEATEKGIKPNNDD
jgi:septal ring factor EnvC (AmiA/AmiB activator)